MWLRTDYAHIPQRFIYAMPFGSNIDVARCGWDAHTMSNSKEKHFIAYNIFCHCERAARAWQSTGKESQPMQGNQTRLIASLCPQ
ncbi:MAG: hypothetical protein K2O85_09260 [Helicobacter sp.]|nr:hypothetical protein [Helicobacter sp.]